MAPLTPSTAAQNQPTRNTTNVVIKFQLTDLVMRSRMIQNPAEMDHLLNQATGRIIKAVHFQDSLLNEKEVAARWKFLDVRKLRNMRYKNQGPRYHKFGQSRNARVFYKICDIEQWIVEHEQLEPYIEGLAAKG